MNTEPVRRLLEEFRSGSQTIESVLAQLRDLPYEDLGFARVDHHRTLRHGFPEVIYCPGKTVEEIVAIAHAIVAKGSNLLATRATPEIFSSVRSDLPDAEFNERARTIRVVRTPPDETPGLLIVSAGTSDMAVAEEAYETATIMGQKVERLYDAGVAGIHRLLSEYDALTSARVIIVVAGMEGALPSVVGGLVDVPVIAVPTSTGYGANFAGVAPLLAMLNSCASGVTVVNIDNGFGAGFAAARINRARGSVPS